MAEKKVGKQNTKAGTRSKAKIKKQVSKRRGQNTQDAAKKLPTKAVLKQMAKDWDQVT